MSGTQEFIVAQDGWLLGRWRQAGERVQLTPAQAEWELRAGRVRPIEETAPAGAQAEPAPKPKAKRSKG